MERLPTSGMRCRIFRRFSMSGNGVPAMLGADRTMIRYASKRSDDAAVREQMRDLSAERCRFGNRRLDWLWNREGVLMIHKKFRRLYREERLQARRRGSRKRPPGTRVPLALPQGVNQR